MQHIHEMYIYMYIYTQMAQKYTHRIYKIYILKRGQQFDGPGCQNLLFTFVFEKVWGSFFDPKPLSIVLLVVVPDVFEVTVDRFASGPPRMAKHDQGWLEPVKNGRQKSPQNKMQTNIGCTVLRNTTG